MLDVDRWMCWLSLGLLMAWHLDQVTSAHSVRSIASNSTLQCPSGTFQCGNDTVCLDQKFWCNNHTDCPGGEDEDTRQCGKKSCVLNDFLMFVSQYGFSFQERTCGPEKDPPGCKCSFGLLMCEQISEMPPYFPQNVHSATINATLSQLDVIPRGAFRTAKNVTRLHIYGLKTEHLTDGIFTGLPRCTELALKDSLVVSWDAQTFTPLIGLKFLILSNNRITLKDMTFHLAPSVEWLFLDRNRIEILRDNTFGTFNPTFLTLQDNVIHHIEPGAFRRMTRLQDLYLSSNRLTQLDGYTFLYNINMCGLFLDDNSIRQFPDRLFVTLRNLKTLSLRNMELSDLHMSLFSPMKSLQHIYFKRFQYCRFAPAVQVCQPKGDGVSSMDNLLDWVVVRVYIWIIAAVICVGNLVVLVGRQIMRGNNNAYNVIIRNLCVSDFLMGVYLFIIACQDIRFAGNYNKYALSWTHSVGCQMTGLTAMVSSEISVFTLALVSFERCLIISYPLERQQMDGRSARVAVGVIWLIGIALSLLPIVTMENPTDFYGSNGLCFPLHIHDPFMPGWEYSAAFFLGINFSAVLSICVVYIIMYCKIRTTTKSVRQSYRLRKQDDMRIAIRLFLLIVTDFLCWIPIIIIKIMALSGYRISDKTYAWFTVVVLPFNSALNPILYSVSTTTFRANVRTQVARRHSGAINRLVSWVQVSRDQPNASQFVEMTRATWVGLRKGRPMMQLDDKHRRKSMYVSSPPVEKTNGVEPDPKTM